MASDAGLVRTQIVGSLASSLTTSSFQGLEKPPAWSRRPACPGGFRLADSGAIIPAIDRTYPLTQAAAAVRRLAEGRPRGKAVISS